MKRKNIHTEDMKRRHELDSAAKSFIGRIRLDDNVSSDEADISFKEVMRKVKARQTMRMPYRKWLWPVAIAAASVALLWGSYVWIKETHGSAPMELDVSLLAQTDTMLSGNVTLRTGFQSFSLDDDVSVVYNNQGIVTADRLRLEKEHDTAVDGLEINQLSVPYGTHANVTLSDGTQIYINAGSKLIYPRTFNGKRREVLLEGEAYLEVAHDERRPFIVKTGENLNVRVLGTCFNVRTYRDEEGASVVLADGSVEVSMADCGELIRLKPNERLVKDRTGIHVNEVDVAEYISWKDNMWIIKSKQASEIFRQLERYYNCSIHADNEVKQRLLSGKLNLTPDVREVIENICLLLSLRYRYVNGHNIYIENINEEN